MDEARGKYWEEELGVEKKQPPQTRSGHAVLGPFLMMKFEAGASDARYPWQEHHGMHCRDQSHRNNRGRNQCSRYFRTAFDAR